MTDPTFPTRVLLAALDGIPTGTVVSVDTFRDYTDEAAQLSGAEKAAALSTACRQGYIHAITCPTCGLAANPGPPVWCQRCDEPATS